MRSFTARLRRPRRRWSRHHSFGLLACIALFTGAGINGWGWLPTGWAVVQSVQSTTKQLPEVAPVRGRVLFVSPHPDDETLAAAGLLQDVQEHGGQAFVVFLTNGDGFPWDARATSSRPILTAQDYLRLGEIRMREALAATAQLGIPAENVIFLGFPDRGLTKIYTENYLVPFRSPYTRVRHVPYDGVLEPNAPYTGKKLEQLLTRVFNEIKPDVVLAPSVLDGHPDHRTASYVATRLASERGEQLYYYIVHGGLEWPLPKGYHPDLPLAPPRLEQQGVRWQRFELDPHEEERKAAAIREYRSQLKILSRFMWAFARDNELLLPANTEGRVK